MTPDLDLDAIERIRAVCLTFPPKDRVPIHAEDILSLIAALRRETERANRAEYDRAQLRLLGEVEWKARALAAEEWAAHVEEREREILASRKAVAAERDELSRIAACFDGAIAEDYEGIAEALRRSTMLSGASRVWRSIKALAAVLRDRERSAREPKPFGHISNANECQLDEADVCGAKCAHGSECLELRGHEGGHETQHGCVFYDESQERGGAK